MTPIIDQDVRRSTISTTNLPVSDAAKYLYEKLERDVMQGHDYGYAPAKDMLDILAAARPETVRDLLWAWREGKLS